MAKTVRKTKKPLVHLSGRDTGDLRASGASLKGIPTLRTDLDITALDPVTKAIIRSIRTRKTFNGGRDFINRVVDSMVVKFPDMSTKSLDGRVCRVLARYFHL